MTGHKIIYVSDLNMGGADSAEKSIPRSGYANIAMQLCRRLAEHGNEVKVLGIGYTGQEHNELFSIIPCTSLQDVVGYINNLKFLWQAEVVIVALDIHIYQESIFPKVKQIGGLKYICITPLESDPLCITWANLLRQMDKVFFISQFGADEAVKKGVPADHIEIGIDTNIWRLRTKEEYEKTRKNLGIEEDEFVIITVADNQERKALGRGMQIVSELKNLHGVKVRHILVTRENSSVGWKPYDLAYELEISSELMVFNNGIPFEDLYALYAASDVYLSCSKGEGLGLPIMESMCIGIPVVANSTGALPELLKDNRGFVVPWSNWYYDPFGNQRRYDIDLGSAVAILIDLKMELEQLSNKQVLEDVHNARVFMERKDWNKSAKQIEDAIEKMFYVEQDTPKNS